MGRTVDLNINYDRDPPFSQAVRDHVDAIFAKCFGGLEEDTVRIVWTQGSHARAKLGAVKKGLLRTVTAFNVNLESTFRGQVQGRIANGTTANNISSICPGNIAADAGGVPNGDIDITTANTTAHEIGFHSLAGQSDPMIDSETKADDKVDRSTNTETLCSELGNWSPEVCNAMRNTLGVS